MSYRVTIVPAVGATLGPMIVTTSASWDEVFLACRTALHAESVGFATVTVEAVEGAPLSVCAQLVA